MRGANKMLNANIPAKIPVPFASGAGASYIRTIPIPSQIGINNGAASFTDGFPPDCFVAAGAGGYPPDGRDFQYILNILSQWVQWQNAGGRVAYDVNFCAAIGGYPNGAVLQSADTTGFWHSTADSNYSSPEVGSSSFTGSISGTTLTVTGTPTGTIAIGQVLSGTGITANTLITAGSGTSWTVSISQTAASTTIAGTGGANWLPYDFYGSAAVTLTNASVTLSMAQYAKPVILLTGTLTANCNLVLPAIVGQWIIANNTTGAYVVTAKTPSGTGVVLSQGSATQVVGDGVNIILVNAGNGVPVGTVIEQAGNVVPPGFLACPLAPGGVGLLSRTTYSALNAHQAASGYPFGAGDGSTTFQMPWFPADYASVQANANVGTETVGVPINHTHPNGALAQAGTNWPGMIAGTSSGYTAQIGILENTGNPTGGGAANLAAGVRLMKCVKY